MSNDPVDNLIQELQRLRLQEAVVIERLVQARARESTTQDELVIGARVFITNRITRIFGRTATLNDRRSYVTRITPTRIYVRTVNGIDTWRLRSNLRIVPDEEAW